MSPAVTRATAASATTITTTPIRSSPIDTEFNLEDRRSLSSAAVREPFVPKRKLTKTAPYTYLVSEATASVHSLSTVAVSKRHSVLATADQLGLSVPARPASALEKTSHASPFTSAARHQLSQATVTSPQRPASTTRSTPRKLAPPLTERGPFSTPISAATTPLLQTRSTLAPSAQDQQPQVRPRSHTPTTMTARTTTPAAAPLMPKIKAPVSADVAARIRSPKKHASTSALRAVASHDQQRMAASFTRTTHPLQQFIREPERVLDAASHAHSSSNWLPDTNIDSSAIEADNAAGESSFVYNADDTPSSPSNEETVQVHVRLRPPKPNEPCAWVPNIHSSTISLDPSLSAARTSSVGPFTFDSIQTGSSNRPVYITVARPLIRAALDGYDAVVFAYGQTASGKTFTLSGDEKGEEAGIIPRAVRDIFRGIKQSSARREYLLRSSYLEIWNEVVKDLLEPSNIPQVRDDKRKRGGKGTTVQPLREEIVTSPSQVRELLSRGQANRHVGATDWNERSSRSHTCFKITIESRDRNIPADVGKKVTVSELCLIDLAGSEKYISQGGERRMEGSHINKSLLTLGKVIYALSERNSGTHIPYRDSKLTRILQNSLSGNARVAVVCTLNPTPNAVEESLSTLKFAKRIKKVGLNAKKNEFGVGGEIGAEAQALILRYQTEADALRKMVLDLQQQKVEETVGEERIRELQERLEIIGSLVVRGGRTHDGEEASDEEGTGLCTPSSSALTAGSSRSTSNSSYARPVSPTKPSLMLSDPPHVLAEKLFLANRRIASLTAELASRPPIPPSSTDQTTLIASLQQEVKELEMVCEAQATDAPPKIREDVEREFTDRLNTMQRRIEEKDEFILELQTEAERLRKVNEKLMELAHSQTRNMMENLASPVRPPFKQTDLNTPRRRLIGEASQKKARPISMLDPPTTLIFPIAGEGRGERGMKTDGRRSISNDYTLLKEGTEEMEEELLLKSATISASETFAALPAFTMERQNVAMEIVQEID
ncbi:hypothetical protein NDA18_005604 [Ustilago nuda]|nr:hypothetical protein NDA18_005604 [Ustilago nuda]